jgi:hypothetical protein
MESMSHPNGEFFDVLQDCIVNLIVEEKMNRFHQQLNNRIIKGKKSSRIERKNQNTK